MQRAFDSHDRCCGDDLSECRCPRKNSDRFDLKIDDFCESAVVCIATASSPFTNEETAGTASSKLNDEQETSVSHDGYSCGGGASLIMLGVIFLVLIAVVAMMALPASCKRMRRCSDRSNHIEKEEELEVDDKMETRSEGTETSDDSQLEDGNF